MSCIFLVHSFMTFIIPKIGLAKRFKTSNFISIWIWKGIKNLYFIISTSLMIGWNIFRTDPVGPEQLEEQRVLQKKHGKHFHHFREKYRTYPTHQVSSFVSLEKSFLKVSYWGLPHRSAWLRNWSLFPVWKISAWMHNYFHAWCMKIIKLSAWIRENLIFPAWFREMTLYQSNFCDIAWTQIFLSLRECVKPKKNLRDCVIGYPWWGLLIQVCQVKIFLRSSLGINIIQGNPKLGPPPVFWLGSIVDRNKAADCMQFSVMILKKSTG